MSNDKQLNSVIPGNIVWNVKLDFTLIGQQVDDLSFETPILDTGWYASYIQFALTSTPSVFPPTMAKPSIRAIWQFDTEGSEDRVESSFGVSTKKFADLSPGANGNPPTPWGCHLEPFSITQQGPASLTIQWDNQPADTPDNGFTVSGYVRVLLMKIADVTEQPASS